jgi:predicted dehydrogenase
VTHAALAIRALNAGKHVFVEKPLALSPQEAEPVLAAAQANNRVLMVGHLLQYHPIFLHLKAIVDEGALGRLHYIYSNRLSLGKLRTEENVLWSFAPHDLSMILALAKESPDHVTAEGAAFVSPGIADWATCHLRFPSGLRAHVQAAWMHPFKEQRLVVVGENATAVFEDSAEQWDQRLALYRHRVDRSNATPALVKADAEYIAVERGEPLRLECGHFLDSISNGATPRTDGAEGLRVLSVLDQAERALVHSLKSAKHD